MAEEENINHESHNPQCPQELDSLANLLTTSISDYGNRIIQKRTIHSRKLNVLPTYIVTVGKPEIEPLPLEQSQYPTDNISDNDNVQQIFFTSLERQYTNDQRIIETENYHWLIITKTTRGWQLVMAFTRFGFPYKDDFVVSPIRDTTNGIIGQAVKLWLKDCEAGTLR